MRKTFQRVPSGYDWPLQYPPQPEIPGPLPGHRRAGVTSRDGSLVNLDDGLVGVVFLVCLARVV